MYTKWATNNGFEVQELDYLEGDEAGIKSVTFLVKGENAYGYLKGEMGVHRLVRISPFDAGGRRHTSFASAEVLPEITEDIKLDINPEDIKMDVYRASGAGGQKVNKTSISSKINTYTNRNSYSLSNRKDHKHKIGNMQSIRISISY